MSKPPDAITRAKRIKAKNEDARLMASFEDHLNRSTEAQFVQYLNGLRPRLAKERLELALRIFRENSRS
jgi:hypothetical protein